MKKKLLLKLGLVILTLVIFSTNVVSAATVDPEVILAQKSGENWIQARSTRPGFEKWSGAVLQNPQILYSINGKPNAFLFSVEANDFIGHMIIGNSGYQYPVFEAGETPPPSIPDINTAKSKINDDLHLRIDQLQRPSRLLYLGFRGIYAQFDLPASIGLNLYSNHANFVSKLKSLVPTPDEYFASKQKTAKAKPLTLTSEFNLLALYAYSGYCGPASLTSIGSYYRQIQGYHDLPSNSTIYSYTYNYPIVDGIILDWEYGPAFESLAETYDYDNFTYVNDYLPTESDYWNRVYDIDHGWPVGLAADQFLDDLGGNWQWPPQDAHWVTIRGYEASSHGVDYAIICADSYTGDSSIWLDWNNVCFSFMFTCTIKNS